MYIVPCFPNWIYFFSRTQKKSPTKKIWNDDQCMKRIAKGEEEPFQVLFKRYGELVLGYCHRLLLDRSQAEDASQEVWVKVIRASKKYKSSGKCRAWILQIARNTCFNLMRKAKKAQFEERNDEAVADFSQEDVLTLLEKHEGTYQLKKLIDQLPGGQRVALLLWMTEEKTYAEIAKEMEITESSVKSLIFRARQSLRGSIGGQTL